MIGRAAAALAGAAGGAVVGVILLVTTHPTSAYTNDAYRGGASIGFVLRYVALGIVAGLLVRVFPRYRVPAGVALAAVLALAIVPPALDTDSESEKRRAAAVAEDDPDRRQAADFRAGLIDGCVTRVTREMEATPEGASGLDVDKYCTCVVDSVVARPGRTLPEMQAIMAQLQSSSTPPPEMQRAIERCTAEAS